MRGSMACRPANCKPTIAQDCHRLSCFAVPRDDNQPNPSNQTRRPNSPDDPPSGRRPPQSLRNATILDGQSRLSANTVSIRATKTQPPCPQIPKFSPKRLRRSPRGL